MINYEEKINEAIEDCKFFEKEQLVIVKDHRGTSMPFRLSKHGLVLLSGNRKMLMVLLPERYYDCGKIEPHQYVIDGILYSIDELIHRSDEEKFYEALCHRPKGNPSFTIHVDSKLVLETDSSRVATKKVKSILKGRKIEGNEFYGCKHVTYREPNGNPTQWVW